VIAVEALAQLLAVEGDVMGSGMAVFLQFGAVGVIAVLGIVFARGAHNDLKTTVAKRDTELGDANAEIKRLNAVIVEAHAVALRETQEALVRSTDVLRDVLDEERASRRAGR
jgi:hypothetical protein